MGRTPGLGKKGGESICKIYKALGCCTCLGNFMRSFNRRCQITMCPLQARVRGCDVSS